MTVPQLLIVLAVTIVVVVLAFRVFAYCDEHRWVDPLKQDSAVESRAGSGRNE